MILKKDWFSDFEILKICGHVSHEEYQQNPPIRTETQNPENQNTADPSTTKPMLTQKDNKFWINKENHDFYH